MSSESRSLRFTTATKTCSCTKSTDQRESARERYTKFGEIQEHEEIVPSIQKEGRFRTVHKNCASLLYTIIPLPPLHS